MVKADISDITVSNKQVLKKSEPAGRPPKEESQKLTKRVSVYFTSDEYDRLKENAGMAPLAKYIRYSLEEAGKI